MAKTESTAVNELIGLMNGKPPIPAEPAADLFEVAPLPRHRAPKSTSEQPMPNVRMRTASPPRGTTIPPLPRRSAPAGTLPPPQQFPVVSPPDAVNDHWFEQQRVSLVATPQKRADSEGVALAKKLVAPGLIVIAAGIVIGAVIATGRNATKAQPHARAVPEVSKPVPRTAEPEEQVLRPQLPRAESENAATATAGGGDGEPPTKAEQAADVAAAGGASMTHEAPDTAVAAMDARATTPGTREVKTPKGIVKLTDVRIDSSPSGATVTLVDAGVQSFIGTTPLATSVDAARQYDIIIALDGRPTQMVHLDPNATSRIDVSLGRKHHAVRPAAIVPAKGDATDGAKDDAPAGDADAKGTLMVSSKPPCELVIDGEPTGLSTPQRALELAPGAHAVTFVNESEGIKKSVSVTIKPGQPTKLIQDLMTK